jgi:cytochrome c-type biogenesis protein CcmH
MSQLIGFVVGALVLIGASLAWLIRPLLRQSQPETPSRLSLNTTIYQEELAKLEHDQRAGLLSPADLTQARDELVSRYLQDTRPTQTQSPASGASAASARTTRWLLMLLLPISAASMYGFWGQPWALIWTPEAAKAGAATMSPADIDRMVATLAAKVAQDPANLEGLAMLVRSYKTLGRMQEAEQAYDRSALHLQRNAAMLSDYADVAAANAQGVFTGKPQQLIDQALRLDPNDLTGLWLAGTAALQARQYPKAQRHWEHLLQQLPPQSDDARLISQALEQLKQTMGRKAP